MKSLLQILLAMPVILASAAVSVAARQTIEPGNPVVSDYILGPDDQISIRVVDAMEISDKPVLIGTSGYITLPMVGQFRASGLTVTQLEAELVSRLKPYIRDPQVSVSIVEFRSQPASVLGAVTNAGVIQLRGHKTLFEVISEAGGLKNDAGNSIKITRPKKNGPIDLPTAAPDSSGQFSVAEVSVKSIMEGRNPQENIQIKPNDVISIPRCKTLPSIISASTRFFAQPKLIMPTFVLILRKQRGLLDGDVGVSLSQCLAIFPDLNRFAIDDPDSDTLAAEFDRSITW